MATSDALIYFGAITQTANGLTVEDRIRIRDVQSCPVSIAKTVPSANSGLFAAARNSVSVFIGTLVTALPLGIFIACFLWKCRY